MVIVAFEVPRAHRIFLREYLSKKVVMLAEKNEPSFPNGSGGTGFYVQAPSGKTYLMTNRHVCQSAASDSLWSSTPDGEKQAKIVAISDDSDLCLLEPPTDQSGINLGSGLALGQTIYYAGHPNLNPFTFISGEAVGISTETIGVGVIGVDISLEDCHAMKDSSASRVSEFQELFEYYPFLQQSPLFPTSKMVDFCSETDAALVTTLSMYPGASGSPVVDSFGQLVGVVYAYGPTSWAYAVPLAAVKSILKGR